MEHTDAILLWGEPMDPNIDVGPAMASNPPAPVEVRVWEMKTPGDPEPMPTEEILTIKSLFCPIDTYGDRPGSLIGKLGDVSST